MNPSAKPCFLITIDTEGDNLWGRPREITTKNARFLSRFQRLCERFQLQPTYLANWEMATCPVFQEFGRDVLKRRTAEVGMHLHAWNSPPIVPLTGDDFRHQPYLIEYPKPVMRDKIHTLTARLEETFGCDIVSHRAGRWAFNATYARMLIERGYRVDCSVTPGVNWCSMQGAPGGKGGTDYSAFRDSPYFVNPADIQQPGASTLLEVPMTVTPARVGTLGMAARRWMSGSQRSWRRRAVGALVPEVRWLRPNGRNLKSMLQILQQKAAGQGDGSGDSGSAHLEFMLHSSEFMPGGSPRFSTAGSIERLYDQLEQLFERAGELCDPVTLGEFEQRLRVSRPPVQPFLTSSLAQ